MEETKKKRNAAEVTAHVISDVFCPLLTPTYAMIIAMCLTRLSYLPGGIRLWTTLAIFGITCMIPLIVIAVLIKTGKVSDMSISDRSQRTVPYLVSIMCYFAASTYLQALHAPLWLPAFFMGAGILSLLCVLITRKWKISAHCAGAAGLAAIVYWLAHNGFMLYAPLAWASVTIIIVGVMAWARLYLNHHTLMQTAAGAVLGFAVVYGIISLMTTIFNIY